MGQTLKLLLHHCFHLQNLQATAAIVVHRNSSLDTSEATFKAKFTLAYKFMPSSTKNASDSNIF
jgi:hypothetical protein